MVSCGARPSKRGKGESAVQAFAAVQASVVHLQGVPLSKRFALVPLGPPILSYSSTSKVLTIHSLVLGTSCKVIASFLPQCQGLLVSGAAQSWLEIPLLLA